MAKKKKPLLLLKLPLLLRRLRKLLLRWKLLLLLLRKLPLPLLTLLHLLLTLPLPLLRLLKLLPSNFWLRNENRPSGRFFYACKKRSSRAMASASRGSGCV
ncbi:hypothetical protein [Thiobacillus sp.]|uniref:hypothetical protein n=1 Tax=Thiobacillus sp. TaxID=924 RepID=UPI001D56E751|nr:hypothetical protein [Thiobacillus sp.]MBC2740898.1 hypothetical protein [Thiobacillus sp.]MBC2759343.1 hypothetical protein [Thiobacillus sp.]